jgi:hypothetical protein
VKSIKNRNVLIVCAGPTVSLYKEKIEKYIQDNNPIIFGCNNVNSLFKLDYHFWGDEKRWKEFGDNTDKKSIIICEKRSNTYNLIKKKWKGKVLTFEKAWSLRGRKVNKIDTPDKVFCKKCKVSVKKNKLYGCFRTIGEMSILWAYIKKASNIFVVGMDGYTVFSKNNLTNKNIGQHWYGSGFTDERSYSHCRKKDWDIYRSLQLIGKYGLKKYGFQFNIITPTLYDKFYKKSALQIPDDVNFKKWKNPTLFEIDMINKLSKFLD